MDLVVVIEQDPAIGELLEIVLGDAGFDVRVLPNPSDLVPEVRSRTPRVVLLDLPPAKDVYADLERVQRVLRGRCTRLVAMTTSQSVEADCRESRHIPALLKPFDLDELVALVTTEVPPGGAN